MNYNPPAIDPGKNPGGADIKAAQHSYRKWVVFIFIFLPLLGFLWLCAYAVLPGSSADEKEFVVLIPKQKSFAEIQTILADHGLIRDDIRFTLLARLTGKAKRLKAGEYLVPAGQTPLQILRLLEAGKTVIRSVILPEGVTIKQIADILAEGGWVEKEAFLARARDPELLEELNLKVDQLEGYLFPDTYYLSREGQSETAIIKMMVTRFEEVYADIVKKYNMEMSLSRHEIVTMASIVEKETGQPFERPLIAAVFLNRLQKNMKLQADPTVIYGIKDFNGNLTRKDLDTPTPYNTYRNRGLPPGPIGNPGRAAIEAVIMPAEENYLYFVSKNDGTHYFSRTLTEHNRAVAKYQKK